MPTPVKSMPTMQAPTKTMPTMQAPAKTMPTMQAPSKVAPTPVAPPKTMPTMQAPSKVAPTMQAPAKTMPMAQAPGEGHAAGPRSRGCRRSPASDRLMIGSNPVVPRPPALAAGDFFLAGPGGRWPMADGRWPMADGRWPMADGRWPMADGRWPMADGRWADGRCPRNQVFSKDGELRRGCVRILSVLMPDSSGIGHRASGILDEGREGRLRRRRGWHWRRADRSF